jgi:hypothetical protein
MTKGNPKRRLAALQHGDDLVDDSIALRISEPAEVLAEYVERLVRVILCLTRHDASWTG